MIDPQTAFWLGCFAGGAIGLVLGILITAVAAGTAPPTAADTYPGLFQQEPLPPLWTEYQEKPVRNLRIVRTRIKL